MKKYWTKIAAAVGPVMIIASVFWEFARITPEYRFLIQPWAMRGTEMIHGTVFLTIGVLLLIVALATAWEGSLKPAVSASIVGFVVIAATVVAAVFAERDFSFTFNPVNTAMVAMLLAAAVAVSTRSLLGKTSKWFKRALPVFLLAFIVLFGLFASTFMNSSIDVPTWQAIFVVFLAIGALTLAIRPLNMGANRMFIVATVAVWATITFSAGAIRQTLLDAQLLADQGDGIVGLSAQYKDLQAASGWWLAGIGATVTFVGAVGIWAKRRDLVAAIARARKQREAAETSTRELREAEEAYRAELEAANSGS